jgi:signal transduction histidine kinase/CheY-like chemotaxis protein/HPt (histidine-containing phosphotransfer) domain-containing protein
VSVSGFGLAPRGALARKYAIFVASAIALALGLNGLIGTVFTFSDQRALVVRVQQEQAQAAAQRIGDFVGDIVRQLDWVAVNSQSPAPNDEARLDGLRLMRQISSIVELRQVDREGRELIALSRSERDSLGSGRDWSGDALFQAALRDGSAYGEIEFRRGSEPYIRLARRSAAGGGAALATINLTFIRELVTRLKVGEAGRAYAVERSGRLIAHPDLRFVLRNTDLSPLLRAHAGSDAPQGVRSAGLSTVDIEGRPVLSVLAAVPDLDWFVVVDLPRSEALAPIRASILRSLAILVAALLLAVIGSVVLSRRLVAPVRALSEGAARIGEGRLDERIAIRTGDELQALGEQFNLMAESLQEGRAALEQKVVERTAALAGALDQASAGQRAAEQARRVAEEATRAKSRFLAVVGHDIRTPLSGVLGVLEILDRKRMSQRDRRLVEMAAVSGETLINLANATLDLSRLEAGTEALDLRDYEPGPLLAAAAALMRPAAERKGLRLGLALDAVMAARLNGDPGKISRVVLNLLANAVTFTDAGEIAIEAALSQAGGPDAAALVITVRDTGIGIEPAMQARIFQDFVQVDPETGRRSGGVGLGLAICSKLVALMGGTLAVSSTPGAGSAFTVSLPAQAARAPASAVAEAATEAPLVVLVVDDEPVTREVARIMIGKAGHSALTAASGEAALALLARQRVDVVLLDMHMTGIDGIETARAIRAMAAIVQPEIVALTADVSPETMRRLRQAGLGAILSKPATSAALLQALGRGRKRRSRSPGVALRTDGPVDRGFLGQQQRLIGGPRLGELFGLFDTVSQAQIAAMREALGAVDRKGLERAAHQFASSASALGLGQAVARAAALETAAANAPFDELTEAVTLLAQARLDAMAGLRDDEAQPAASARPPQALRSAKMPSL